MTRESDLATLREGLLPGEKAQRTSHEQSDDSESDLEINELEELNGDPSLPRIRGGWSPLKRRKKGKKNPDQPSKRRGGWLRNKTWMFVIALLVAGLIAYLAGSYAGVFKKLKPQDGVSQAFSSQNQKLMLLHLAFTAMVQISQRRHGLDMGRQLQESLQDGIKYDPGRKGQCHDRHRLGTGSLCWQYS